MSLELGIPLDLGSTPYKPFASYATDCWYKILWKFAAEHLIQIHEDYPNVSLLREGDQFLMQAFVNNGFRGQDLSWFNTMRMAINSFPGKSFFFFVYEEPLSYFHSAFN